LENQIKGSFLDIVKPLDNICYVANKLREKNIFSIIITVGPRQVAQAACDIWGFDACYGSDYEVVDGIFTGKINSYISAGDKVNCLRAFCDENNIFPNNCIAVGDGSTDIPVFEYCGKSIAINAKPNVKKKATYSIDTDDLMDILHFIV